MSRQRAWVPTGVLVPVSRVKVYRRTLPGHASPEKVIIRLRGGRGERTEAFRNKTAAEAYKKQLDRAVAKGEDFDAGTFLPVSMGPPPTPALEVHTDDRLRWVDFAAFHADEMALEGNKTKTRSARHEALRQIVWLLVDDTSDHPGRNALKAFCDVWLKPVAGDPHLTKAARAAQRTAERAKRLANLSDRVLARPMVFLSADQVLAAGEWLRAHSEFVDTITPDRANDVLKDFRHTLDGGTAAPTTRNRKRQVLHKMLEDAVRTELISLNPMDRLNLRGYASAAVRTVDRSVVMDPHQVEAFINNVGHHPETGDLEEDDRYSAFVALMAREGLRPSEAAAVKVGWCALPKSGWGQLRLGSALVSVSGGWSESGEVVEENPLKWTDHTGKGKHRKVPLSPETVASIRSHIARYGTGPNGRLSSAREGGPVNPWVLNRVIAKARDRTFADESSPHFVGQENHPLRQMTAYACRHAAASAMLNAGIPPKVVADRMGHDLPVLLKVYANTIDADAALANGLVDEYRAKHLRGERAPEQPVIDATWLHNHELADDLTTSHPDCVGCAYAAGWRAHDMQS